MLIDRKSVISLMQICCHRLCVRVSHLGTNVSVDEAQCCGVRNQSQDMRFN